MKIFYGWRIVVAGGALLFLQSMLLNQAFGAYLAALVAAKKSKDAALVKQATERDQQVREMNSER